jgi:hypothetical protein
LGKAHGLRASCANLYCVASISPINIKALARFFRIQQDEQRNDASSAVGVALQGEGGKKTGYPKEIFDQRLIALEPLSDVHLWLPDKVRR